MRERTTWSRQKIAGQLKRVAEDPRAMNQDHLSQQPAADAYVIGGPSDFAEDQSPPGKGWKAELGADGNTKRDEIGMPEYRSDTFSSPEKSPGVSPSRQASYSEVHAKAEVATRVARLMLPRSASEGVIEDQALALMDLPLSNLNSTLTRLAQEQDDEDDEDEGQSKEASQDDEDDEDEGQSKQAKDLPPEFLKNIQKKKDEAKDKDDDKGQSKEARRRPKAQQQDDDEDEGQSKQARSRRAQQQDDEDEGQSKEARRRLKAQQQDDGDEDEGQSKEARRLKAQQQEDDGEDEGQSKQARSRRAQDEKEGDDDEKQVGKEAYALIKQAAAGLLQLPVSSRPAAFKIALPGLMKAANEQLGPLANQDQVQAQVQQLVQNAMQQLQGQQQQQLAQGQQQQLAQGQQQMLADDALVDQMLQDPGDFSEQSIQLDAPDMDLGLSGEDPALQQIFASSNEVQLALEARALQSGHAAPARTASTRTVGTRPSAGVSVLGGVTSGGSGESEDINRLSSMWASAPDVSNVFRS